MRKLVTRLYVALLLLFLTSLVQAQMGNVASANPAGLDPAVEKLKSITVLP